MGKGHTINLINFITAPDILSSASLTYKRKKVQVFAYKVQNLYLSIGLTIFK